MTELSILKPVVGMFVLTFVVWTYLYIRRIGYMRREQIHPQAVRSPGRKHKLIPEEVDYPANNLANLTELPVIFYALCLLLYVTSMADTLDVAMAWAYFLFRAVHSAVQCTFNRVMLRFSVYMVSSLILWFMLFRTVFRMFVGT